jgi:hypothetical protein
MNSGSQPLTRPRFSQRAALYPKRSSQFRAIKRAVDLVVSQFEPWCATSQTFKPAHDRGDLVTSKNSKLPLALATKWRATRAIQSPDGRYLGFLDTALYSDAWLLENF